MTRPTTETAHQVSTPSKTDSQTLKVKLLIENGDHAEWLIQDLNNWITPESSTLELTQAIADMFDADWFQRDPKAFLETISLWQNKIQTQGNAFHQVLEQKGFQITEESVIAHSDQGGRQILQEIKQNHYDLLVIGAYAAEQTESQTISSFTNYLATHAPCSVLVMKKPIKHSEQKRVLLATDGSEASATAARKLPELLNTEHMLATVAIVQSPDYMESAIFAPYVNAEAIGKALDENARLVLSMAAELLEAGGVKVHNTVQMMGSPSVKLMELTQQEQPDLLVVGSHNRTGLPAWLLGSVSSRLLQSDPHNILVVR